MEIDTKKPLKCEIYRLLILYHLNNRQGKLIYESVCSSRGNNIHPIICDHRIYSHYFTKDNDNNILAFFNNNNRYNFIEHNFDLIKIFYKAIVGKNISDELHIYFYFSILAHLYEFIIKYNYLNKEQDIVDLIKKQIKEEETILFNSNINKNNIIVPMFDYVNYINKDINFILNQCFDFNGFLNKFKLIKEFLFERRMLDDIEDNTLNTIVKNNSINITSDAHLHTYLLVYHLYIVHYFHYILKYNSKLYNQL